MACRPGRPLGDGRLLARKALMLPHARRPERHLQLRAAGVGEACTRARMHACMHVHVICRHEQRDALLHEAEAGKEMGHAYAQKAAAVAEAVSTSDLRSTLLEDQCKLLAHAVRDEEAKVHARDEMLH